MPAKKTNNKEHPDTSSPNQVLSAKERHAEAQARYRAHHRAYIKSSEELSKQAAETRWGIDKEYREVKRMRIYTERYGLAALTNCYIPAKKEAGSSRGLLAAGSKRAKARGSKKSDADVKD
ncbi:hypothetical protein DFH08DRAFT_807889 [Mycena albidolilacea]|uniref:Uncharacterized protein n=1 Tax=Mycena albidolilacea TaxID=1033008 RepID=A0AAD7A5J4_9AGAR|nr:hypothetical protein DFH08DRAFT_807889 [Mycena albidolilacea]